MGGQAADVWALGACAFASLCSRKAKLFPVSFPASSLALEAGKADPFRCQVWRAVGVLGSWGSQNWPLHLADAGSVRSLIGHCLQVSTRQWRRAILSLGAVAPPKTKIRGPGPPQNRRSGAGS